MESRFCGPQICSTKKQVVKTLSNTINFALLTFVEDGIIFVPKALYYRLNNTSYFTMM